MNARAQIAIRSLGTTVAGLGMSCVPARAQLNQNCSVTVLNRTVNANPDGTWVLPNVPANFGQVKARATCIQNGVTTFGESAFFNVPANAAANLPPITMGNTTPIPVSLSIASVPALTSGGQTAQLAVTATYPDSSTKDVTASKGTNYTISNPAIATISSDGLVTARTNGTVVIQANNDGAAGIATVVISVGGAKVGGIPVSWLTQFGLNPNDPLVALEDSDRDGLTNLQEYQAGTNPINPDTDGDGLSDGDEVNKHHTNPLLADTDGDKISDGVEIQTGTNPLDAKSYDLKKATAVSTVTPSSFTLTTSGTNQTPSIQLHWTVKLIDGKTTLDLTKSASYTSSNPNVCQQQQQAGLILAVGPGSCTITISQNTLSATASGTVTAFTPTELSTLNVPGAIAVDVAGAFVYIGAGTNGLVVVDVNDKTKPFTRGALAKIGDAQGVRANSQYAFIADATGFLRIVDVQNPDSPSLVSTLPISGKPSALAVHGTLAAIAAQSGGVSLVNISNPKTPKLLATFAVPGAALGVDFDPQSGLAAVAMGTSGLQLADISNPTAPKQRGLLAGGDVLRVVLKLPAALLADSSRSITSVDVRNPDAPVLSASVSSSFGGVPVDIAAFGNIAIAAESTFGKGTPIINVSDPLHPAPLPPWTWQTSPGYGTGIAMDISYAYLVLGVQTSTLRILQYQSITDTFGIPPKVSITAPAVESTLIQGETITVSANATDDVAVASVNFLVDGQNVFTTSAVPYQFSYTVPSSATLLTFGATATDFGKNVGVAQNVQVPVIPDPGTTVTGKVVDASGKGVSGSTVSLFGVQSSTVSTTTKSDGSFSLSGVPTIFGNVQLLAKFVTSSGATLAGYSTPVAPVPNGSTNAGTITVLPIPLINKLGLKSGLAGSQLTLQVRGTTLVGATWAFQPPPSSSVAIQVASTSPDGKSATLNLTLPTGVAGTFALVASNVAGNSGSSVNAVDRFTVVDPNSTADTDHDGFQDAIEAVFGTDPLDPNSFPVILTLPEVESEPFSVLNAPVTGSGIKELESSPFSVLNAPVTGSGLREAESLTFSVLNSPVTSAGVQEVESRPYWICNTLNGAACPAPSSSSQSAKSSAAAMLRFSSKEPATGMAGAAGALNPLLDSDGDGLPDWYEVLIGTDPLKADTDGDGLSDFEEIFVYHTDPLNADTDGDGFSDGEEVLFGSNPLDQNSTPLSKPNRPAVNGNSNSQGEAHVKRNSKKVAARRVATTHETAGRISLAGDLHSPSLGSTGKALH